jgi:hypothetical protein
MARVLQSCWAVARFIARQFAVGMMHYGFSVAGVSPDVRNGAQEADDEPHTAAVGPPEEHPERLVPELPPTKVERSLWAQFD